MMIVTDDEVRIEVHEKSNYLWYLMGVLITTMVFLALYEYVGSLKLAISLMLTMIVSFGTLAAVGWAVYKLYRSY